MAPQLTDCCGLPLRTGTIIIGVLGTIGALFTLESSIVYADAAHNALDDNWGTLSKEDKDSLNGAIMFYVILAIISVTQLILNIMLVIGATKKNPRLIKPWITAAIIRAEVGSFLCIAEVLMLLVVGAIVPAILDLIRCSLSMCIYIYFILVVHSFFKEIVPRRQVI